MDYRGLHFLRHPWLETPSSWLLLTWHLQVLVQYTVWAHNTWPPHFHHQPQGHHQYLQNDPFRHKLAFPLSTRRHDIADDDDERLCMLCERGHLLQAMALLSHIGSSLQNSSYIALLKACIVCKAAACARQAYSHLIQHGNDITPALQDYLAVVFSKCGAIDDACQIFYALSHRTVLSWTAIISALTDSGCLEEALQLFCFMQEDTVTPDTYTFVTLFKACGSISDLHQGKRLHALALENGYISDVFVGNTLVSMYGKCGDALAAEDVFSALPLRSIVSWNAMLSVFMEDGQADCALLLYRQMLEEVMDPDQVALMFALQACSSLADEDKLMAMHIGQTLHSLARARCSESDMFVGTALISMYGKCGATQEAEYVFAALLQHDVATWNAMFSVYIHQSQEEKVLQLFTQMNEKGLNPDQRTYVYVFQACGNFADQNTASTIDRQSACVKFLSIGQVLHSDMCRQGLTINCAIRNSLVSMYGRYGAVMEAENVFKDMCEHDTLSWSTMLSVYVEQGRGRKALQLYGQMQKEGVSPDAHCLVLVLQACVMLAQEPDGLIAGGSPTKVIFLEFGQALFVDAHRKGVCMDIYVGNALITLYGKYVGVTEAQDVFISLPKRDVVSWTGMLSAYVEHGKPEEALQLYKFMHEEQIPPNQVTFVIALHACDILVNSGKASPVKEGLSKLKVLDIVQALRSDADRGGFTTDTFVKNTFIATYGKCGSIVEAEILFNNLPHPDIAAWNALLSAYLECDQAEVVLCLHKEMQKKHLFLNGDALNSLFRACIDTQNLEMCRELHFYATSDSCAHKFLLATSLICAYGSCARVEELQAVFEEICRPDLVSWTACIAGNAGSGNCVVASADVLERSKLAGVRPDEVILSTLLFDCGNRGFVIEGLEYCLSSMRDFGVKLNLRHCCIMMDLLGRAGDFKRMGSILNRMPMQADLAIWSALLGACQIHGNVELAKCAFERALLVEPTDASLYVIMSNICTSTEADEGADGLEFLRTCMQRFHYTVESQN